MDFVSPEKPLEFYDTQLYQQYPRQFYFYDSIHIEPCSDRIQKYPV